MYKVSIHSFVTHEGHRKPYRVSSIEEQIDPIAIDDRVEHGVFLTDAEFEAMRSGLSEVARFKAETVESIERTAFEAACALRDRPDFADWESAYRQWCEQVRGGAL
jgi:hypothetical protein